METIYIKKSTFKGQEELLALIDKYKMSVIDAEQLKGIVNSLIIVKDKNEITKNTILSIVKDYLSSKKYATLMKIIDSFFAENNEKIKKIVLRECIPTIEDCFYEYTYEILCSSQDCENFYSGCLDVLEDLNDKLKADQKNKTEHVKEVLISKCTDKDSLINKASTEELCKICLSCINNMKSIKNKEAYNANTRL